MNGDSDLGRKRKAFFVSNDPEDAPSLSLSFCPSHPSVPSIYSLEPTPQQTQAPILEVDQDAGLNNTIVPPYPWATNRRATVYSYDWLMSHNIRTIKGRMQCKHCEKYFDMEYDLHERFTAIKGYVLENRVSMRDRAPAVWIRPLLPRCDFCGKANMAKPVLPEDKDGINWLFLFLGELIGCCTLEQLKYFCKHTKKHRTGAKDRILYCTYLGMCKQLDPKGPFDPFHK